MNRGNVKENEFYVRCPSNVTGKDNTPNKYQWNLSHALEFDDPYEWEVGLHEIFLPKNFYNFVSPITRNAMRFERKDLSAQKIALENLENQLKSEMEGYGPELPKERIQYYAEQATIIQNMPQQTIEDSECVINIPPGFYTCAKLASIINIQLRERHYVYMKIIGEKYGRNSEFYEKELNALRDRRFDYNPNKAKFHLTLGLGDVVHFNNEGFNSLVGMFADEKKEDFFVTPIDRSNIFLRKSIIFRTYQNTNPANTGKSVIHFPNTCDLDFQCRHVYVYVDCIEETRVGDHYAPLIRIVNMESNYSKENESTTSIHREFRRPQYFPIAKRNNFKTINIEMTNSLGEPFPFKGGISILDLHFRKR